MCQNYKTQYVTKLKKKKLKEEKKHIFTKLKISNLHNSNNINVAKTTIHNVTKLEHSNFDKTKKYKCD